ncbi:MAG: NfeD family protein [Bacteroidota bacterium]
MFIYIALLIILGVILLVLEILILPGMIAGIVGGLFLLVAITFTFKTYGTTAGIYTSLGTVALTTLSLYISFKSKVWKRFSLKGDLRESKANMTDAGSLVAGMEAQTVSALRPMGMVMIDDLKVEARSNGELISEGKTVVILKVLSSGVLVREKI